MSLVTRSVKEQIAAHYELSKQLNAEYDKVYTDMVVYLRTSMLAEADVEDVINDILVMMLEGQARGATAESVFGEDYKRFCDEMIGSIGRGNWTSRLKEYFNMLMPGINITLFFSWFITMDAKGLTDFKGMETVNLSVAFLLNILFMWMAVSGVFWWIHTSTYNRKIRRLPEWGSAMVGGLVFTAFIFALAFVSKGMDRYVLAQFHIGWLLGLMAVLWLAGRVMGKMALHR